MRLTPEQLDARKRRNVALALALVCFVVVVFIATVLKLRGNDADREARDVAVAAQAQ